QYPIELVGTFPLPVALLDRFFFKLVVDYPTRDDLLSILDRTTKREVPTGQAVMDGHEITRWQGFVRDVAVAPPVADYAVRLVLATQPTSGIGPERVGRYVRYGSSPRGAQALLLGGKVNALRSGRFNVSFDDIKSAAVPALRHRVLLNFEADADRVTSDDILSDILRHIPTAEKAG
ncbi:MAG: MoxR family ATPase, partial [FCB group bacterium]|nr:MoxR family ATPase [FCB group bacterium]